MTTSPACVSVIIPTRDRTELREAALASVVGQRYAGAMECLVVFDGTAPDMADHSRARNRQVRVLQNDRTPGPAGARNVGLLAAKGELVAFCDDDDLWRPGKLQAQVEALRRDAKAIGCCTGYLQVTGTRVTARRPKGQLCHRDLLLALTRSTHLSTVLLRRDRLLTEVGLFDENCPYSYGEDYDWLLRATQNDHLVTVTEPLVRVLRHPGSFFFGNWDIISEAIPYLLRKHPDLTSRRRGASRLYGRLAFAHAARGRHAEALHWIRLALRTNPVEMRAYLALLVRAGLVRPQAALRLAKTVGKGI